MSSSFCSSFNVPRFIVILLLFDSVKDEAVYTVDFLVLKLILLESFLELANVTIFLNCTLGVLVSATAGFKAFNFLKFIDDYNVYRRFIGEPKELMLVLLAFETGTVLAGITGFCAKAYDIVGYVFGDETSL